MKKIILVSLLIILLLKLFSAIGDTLVVQTLSFDDIEKRRDVFQFSNDDRTWEKF